MKIKKIIVFILIYLLINANFAYAQELVTWTECVEQAKENNPDLISAGEKVKQAKADRNIDLSTVLPQLDSGVDGKRGKTAGSTTSNTYSYGISGQQLLFDGFKTASEVTSALKTIQAQQYDYNVISSNVRLDLRNAFVGLMKAQELIGITESIAERRRQNLELVKLRYQSGREHKGSLMTAEADMAQAEFEIAQAKRSVPLSQRELSKALGFSEMKPWKAEGEFLLKEDYSNKPDLALLAENTPFLMELIMKKEAARYNLHSSEADFFPKVYLDGSLGRTDKSWPPQKKEWSAGVSLSFPLFEGGSRIAEVTKAKSQWDQAKADQRSGHYSILVTLERSWKDLLDAIANVSVQKKFLDATQERAKITRAQYETGLASFNDWIIIEDNLVRSKKSYLNAQADMLIAEAYWIQAIGGTLEYGQE